MQQILESNRFGHLSMNDLLDFEEHNDLKLPDDYRQFLVDHNGGRPSRNIVAKVKTDVHWIYSMCEEPEWASFFFAIEMFQNRIPSWYIPIGCDSGGNQFIMSLYEDNKGVIAIWFHEEEHPKDGTDYYENMLKIADNFTEFIENLQ